MSDRYPLFPSLPQEWLVPPEDQPEYLDLPDRALDEDVNLGAALSDEHVVAGRGGDLAIVHHESGEEITFAELAERSAFLSAALAGLGVSPGDRVAVRSPNRPEGIIAQIAVWKMGAVMVPIPLAARASELDHFFADTRPTAIVTHGDQLAMVAERAMAAEIRHVVAFCVQEVPDGVLAWADLLETGEGLPSPAPVPLDAIAVVWHTGGTTGVPKGCYHTQRRFLLAGYSFGLATGSGRGQRWAAAAPIGHALGVIHHTIFTLLHGATIVLVERFADPKQLLRAIQHHEVTVFTAIAASWAGMHRAIATGEAPEPSTLRRGYAMWQSSTGSETFDAWRARGIELLNNFGSTAFAAWVLVPQGDGAVPRASLGSPAPGYEVRVVDPVTGDDAAEGAVGQMIVRGPSGLTYWRLPDKQRADVRGGWVYVDDLVQLADGTNYRYMGRTDFLISTAGYKVAPSEVEEVLKSHPSVKEVCVVGVPDDVRQEVVAAFVVVSDGVSESDELRLELQNLVKSNLSPYKYPRILEWLAQLPRDHVGKVQPAVVREQALRERSLH
jgi:2-aminobenzoate-CoA ligase